MRFLPLCFDLKDRTVVLAGGGEKALRKGRLLARAGARLRVSASDVCPELQQLACDSGGEVLNRGFVAADLQGSTLAVGASDDDAENAAVSAAARAAVIPVNVVDQPDLSDFVFPAIVDRDPLLIAISSGGAAPVLARMLRARIESIVPNAFGTLAGIASRARAAVHARLPSGTQRRRFWERVLQGPVAELAFAGKSAESQALLDRLLQEEDPEAAAVGEVYLVGAGPGDPDLLTFRALRLMQQADVVLYDRLVSNEILEMVRRDADRIYVGKARSAHAVPQEDINQMLLRLALEGKRVLRLKGGDPFIFGRGGEEIELLAEHGVPFQVVPGITAASGCASYAGIPLTHRDHAQSVRFVTGHLKDGSAGLDWAQFQNPAETLVFYMGLTGLAEICQGLVSHGRRADTPVALVQQGTTLNQRVICGTLANIVERVAAESVRPPTLIIVGDVVQLHAKLSWFAPLG